MNIDIEVKQLQKYSLMCDNYIDDFDEKITAITNNIEDIRNAWVGEDANNYFEQMNFFISELQKLKEQIVSYNDYLKGYLQAVNELDSVFGSKSIDIK